MPTISLWYLLAQDISNINMKNRLCIDMGNTWVKYAVVSQDKKVLSFTRTKNFSKRTLGRLYKEFNLSGCILSSTRDIKKEILALLKKKKNFILLTHKTQVPIKNGYDTPGTLGKDRLAAVIGAHALYPNHPSLVIDPGTCITYDVITSDGKYLGGNISPGYYMRRQAMHRYTDKLPMVEAKENNPLLGTSTVKAMQNGAFYGTTGEMESFIRWIKKDFTGIKVLMTGGDAEMFAKHLNSKIFVLPYLVMIGLNEILTYNAP